MNYEFRVTWITFFYFYQCSNIEVEIYTVPENELIITLFWNINISYLYPAFSNASINALIHLRYFKHAQIILNIRIEYLFPKYVNQLFIQTIKKDKQNSEISSFFFNIFHFQRENQISTKA